MVATLMDDFAARLESLVNNLPQEYQLGLHDTIRNLGRVFADVNPMVLAHAELVDNNILVHPTQGGITGVTSWSTAEVMPFGVSLWALEDFLGYVDGPRGSWQYYDRCHDLVNLFWSTFQAETGPLSAAQKENIRVAREVGFFLRHGFTWDPVDRRERPAVVGDSGLDFLGLASMTADFLRSPKEQPSNLQNAATGTTPPSGSNGTASGTGTGVSVTLTTPSRTTTAAVAVATPRTDPIRRTAGGFTPINPYPGPYPQQVQQPPHVIHASPHKYQEQQQPQPYHHPYQQPLQVQQQQQQPLPAFPVQSRQVLDFSPTGGLPPPLPSHPPASSARGPLPFPIPGYAVPDTFPGNLPFLIPSGSGSGVDQGPYYPDLPYPTFGYTF
jgi:hypothetical protein